MSMQFQSCPNDEFEDLVNQNYPAAPDTTYPDYTLYQQQNTAPAPTFWQRLVRSDAVGEARKFLILAVALAYVTVARSYPQITVPGLIVHLWQSATKEATTTVIDGSELSRPIDRFLLEGTRPESSQTSEVFPTESTHGDTSVYTDYSSNPDYLPAYDHITDEVIDDYRPTFQPETNISSNIDDAYPSSECIDRD